MKIKKILIIDDDEKIRFAFHTLLEREGYNIVEASDGEQALEIFISDQFQLVFLDLELPDEDGLKLLEKMRKIDDTVLIVVITSLGSQQAATKARHLGASEYLEKPISLSHIREILIQFQKSQA